MSPLGVFVEEYLIRPVSWVHPDDLIKLQNRLWFEDEVFFFRRSVVN